MQDAAPLPRLLMATLRGIQSAEPLLPPQALCSLLSWLPSAQPLQSETHDSRLDQRHGPTPPQWKRSDAEWDNVLLAVLVAALAAVLWIRWSRIQSAQEVCGLTFSQMQQLIALLCCAFLELCCKDKQVVMQQTGEQPLLRVEKPRSLTRLRGGPGLTGQAESSRGA